MMYCDDENESCFHQMVPVCDPLICSVEIGGYVAAFQEKKVVASWGQKLKSNLLMTGIGLKTGDAATQVHLLMLISGCTNQKVFIALP
jgi:hypothetical protein